MINVSHADGVQSKVAVFKASSVNALTLIILPAMGVKATYYKRFAETLKSGGFNVLLTDWRGNGSSRIRAGRQTDFGYQQLINDVTDLVGLANIEFPGSKVIILGHSLGGQIGTLYAGRYHSQIAALILITTCNVHFKNWKGFSKLRVLLAGLSFYPLSMLIGYFPGNAVGFGAREAKTVMKDWCSNALTGKYKLTASKFDDEQSLANLKLPVLAISVVDDRLADKNPVISFLKKLHPAALVTHIELSQHQINVPALNHFSWIKKPDIILQYIKDWSTF